MHSRDFVDALSAIADKDGIKTKISKESERGFITGLIDSDGYFKNKVFDSDQKSLISDMYKEIMLR